MVGAPKVVVISRCLSTGDRDGRAGGHAGACDLSSSSSSEERRGGGGAGRHNKSACSCLGNCNRQGFLFSSGLPVWLTGFFRVKKMFFTFCTNLQLAIETQEVRGMFRLTGFSNHDVAHVSKHIQK